MQIREATVEDVPQMLRLWYELMHLHREHHLVLQVKDGVEKLIAESLIARIEDTASRFFVCESEGQIAGFIATNFRITQEAMIYNRRGYIAETVVGKQFRGKGIGKLLFEKAQQWFEEEGADHIELQVSLKNDGGLNFWKNQGFSGFTQHMIKYLKKN